MTRNLNAKLYTHEPNQPDRTRKITGPEGTVYFIPLTQTRTLYLSVAHKWNPARITRKIAWQIRKALFDYTQDSDCDGDTLLITDKLTNGELFTLSAWNFNRSHGSNGYRLNLGRLNYGVYPADGYRDEYIEKVPPRIVQKLWKLIEG